MNILFKLSPMVHSNLTYLENKKTGDFSLKPKPPANKKLEFGYNFHPSEIELLLFSFSKPSDNFNDGTVYFNKYFKD